MALFCQPTKEGMRCDSVPDGTFGEGIMDQVQILASPNAGKANADWRA